MTKELRQQRKFRGNTRRGADKRTTITEAIRIDERPVEALGAISQDTGKVTSYSEKIAKVPLVLLVERSTRSLILVHLKARIQKNRTYRFWKKKWPLPELMKKSLTYDNGTEMGSINCLQKKHESSGLFYILTALGNGLPTKIQTGYYASIFQKVRS